MAASEGDRPSVATPAATVLNNTTTHSTTNTDDNTHNHHNHSNTTHKYKFLLVGRNDGVYDAAKRIGWELVDWLSESTSLHEGQGMLSHLKRRTADILIITLPTNAGKGDAHLKKLANRFKEFIYQAARSDVHTVVTSRYAGMKGWTADTLKRLADDHTLHVTHHRYCGLGISLTTLPNGTMSKQARRLATSFMMMDNHCPCAPSIKHDMEWSKEDNSSPAAVQRRTAADQKFFEHILPVVRTQAEKHRPSTQISSASVCLEGKHSHLDYAGSASRPGRPLAPGLEKPEYPQSCAEIGVPLSSAPQRGNLGLSEEGFPSNTHDQTVAEVSGESGFPDNTTTQSCLPTASRERQKAKEKSDKEAGITKTKPKSKKVVEAHYDDCGDSLDGLNLALFAGADQDIFEYEVDSEGSDDDDEVIAEDFGDCVSCFSCDTVPLHVWSFLGDTTLPRQLPEHVHVAPNMQTIYTWACTSRPDEYVDIVELCGGAGRPLEIAVHRRMRAGRNFDLTTGVNLLDPQEVQAYWSYLDRCRPRAVVMAPPCTPFGPWANLNSVMNPQSHAESLRLCKPLAQLSGETAWHQLQQTRPRCDFLNEQPDPSYLYEVHPWPRVLNHPRVTSRVIDQCATGQKARHGQHTGKYIRKRTRVVGSCDTAMDTFNGYRCNGRHEHVHATGQVAAEARLWTWMFAALVIEYCRKAIRARDRECSSQLAVAPCLPVASTSSAQPWADAIPEEQWRKCPGCRGKLEAGDTRHSRKPGECKWPLVQPDAWACPGCVLHKPRGHASHNEKVGECKWGSAGVRYRGRERTGRHPRAPRLPAVSDPSAGLRLSADDPDDQAGDDDIPDPSEQPPGVPSGGTDEDGVPHSSTARGSRDEAPPPEPESVRPGDDELEPPASSGSAAVRRARNVVRKIDAATGPDDGSIDWDNFDLSTYLRVLRTGTDPAKRRTLRKLHLRWWHASLAAMRRLLSAAGVPEVTLALLPAIIDTCRVCRLWARPGPRNITSVTLHTKFNDAVQFDLLFHGKHIIVHLVDSAIRWAVAEEVTNKDVDTILTAIVLRWITPFGPPLTFVCDGESALRTDAAARVFTQYGTSLSIRAKGQHANIVEKRNDLLRQQLLRVDTQLRDEGLLGEVPFPRRLGEAVLAGNVLLSINNGTPYQALYGRVPNVLPDVDLAAAAAQDHDPSLPMVARCAHRLRELNVQAIVEGTAKARLDRAMSTKTKPAGEEFEYQVGDQVEFYTPPESKDQTGWRGPATINDLSQLQHGTIGLKWQSFTLTRKIADVRRALTYLVLLATGPLSPPGVPLEGTMTTAMYADDPLEVVRSFLLNLTDQVMFLGWRRSNDGTWTMTRDTQQHKQVYVALLHVASCGFHLVDCVSMRLGVGKGSVPGLSEFADYLMCWWEPRTPYDIYTQEGDATTPLRLRKLLNSNTATWIQFLTVDTAVTDEVQRRAPDIPNLGGPMLPSMAELRFQPSEASGPRIESVASDDVDDDDADNNDQARGDNPESSFYKWDDWVKKGSLPHPTVDDLESRGSLTHPCHAGAPKEHWEEAKALESWDQVFLCTAPPDVFHDPVHVEPDYHKAEAGLCTLPTPAACELEFPACYAALISDAPQDLAANQVVVQQIFSSGARKTVVETDTDILTPDELHKHKEAVVAAILAELKTWQHYGCFSRKARRNAKNIIDVRWVIKWKYVRDEHGQDKRVIRARLTVRGFKDADAAHLASYSGTTSRWGQRLIAATAAQMGWELVTMDIEKAFLQGISYEDLARETGEPLREVNFQLPSGCVPLLRQLDGYSDYCPVREVLHLDKPGTGLKDAPRCFSKKLSRCTSAFGLTPLHADDQVEVMHRDGELVLIIGKHVDDIKVAGQPQVVSEFISHLEKTFGKLKVSRGDFDNCGVRHVQHADGSIELNQQKYAMQLKPINSLELQSGFPESSASEQLAAQFISLLGAVAYLLLTRVDVAVYVAALQRVSKQPLLIHVKRLNAVTRWVQRNPRSLHYKKLPLPVQLLSMGDSAFKREDTDNTGHAMKGGMFMLHGGTPGTVTTGPIQLLEYYSRKQRHVCRSTYAAELFSLTEAVDVSIHLASALYEVAHGVQTTETLRLVREGGLQSPVAIVVVIDADSVYTSVTALQVKAPAEKSLLVQLQWLRELLDRRVVHTLAWCDTRDMISDALTKGSVDRARVHAAMDGKLIVEFTAKTWRSSVGSRGSPDDPTGL